MLVTLTLNGGGGCNNFLSFVLCWALKMTTQGLGSHGLIFMGQDPCTWMRHKFWKQTKNLVYSTTSIVQSDAWIWANVKCGLQGTRSLRNVFKGLISTKIYLGSTPWTSVGSKGPSKVTLRSRIQGNYAGGAHLKVSLTEIVKVFVKPCNVLWK